MAAISLRDYLEKIDSLLEDSSYEAAIFHSQHILKQQPRNLGAYRRLYQALMGSARWQEANEILLRVLNVAPDDRAAHIALGEVYQHIKRPDDAIWHLERAYELDPNDEHVQSALTELYQTHRNIENPHFQLSAGSAARQYLRNQLYDQAVEVLIQAIERNPRRGDLYLLLATVHQEAGRPVEAAETALDVLEHFPDCLDANALLARFWLEEKRPSDAQRYLSRIEPIAPYLALRIATEGEPDYDAVELQEGDYQRIAHRELTQTSPDWLTSLGTEEDTAAEMIDSEEPETEAADIDFDMDDFDLEDDDWLSDIGDETADATPVEGDMPDNLLGMFDDMDDIADSDVDFAIEDSDEDDPFSFDAFDTDEEAEPAIDLPKRKKGTGLTGLLSIFDEESDEKAEEETPQEEIPEAELTADDLDLDDDDDEADPLAWMTDNDVVVEDDEPTPTRSTSEMPSSDSVDPLAWMHQSGVEVVEGADDEVYDPYGLEDSGSLADPDSVDPLAWMRQSGVEVEDDEQPLAGDVGEDEDAEADPLAWLQDSGIEITDDEEETPATDFVADFNEEATEQDQGDSWLDDDSLLDEVLDMEALTTGDYESINPDADEPEDEFVSEMEPNEEWQDDMTDDSNNWLNDDESSDPVDEPEWLQGEPFEEDEETAGAEAISFDLFEETDEEAALDWMAEPTNMVSDDAGNFSNDATDFDWSAELEDDAGNMLEDGGNDDEFQWSDELDDAPESGETPDWLGEFEGTGFEDELENSESDEETPDWLGEFEDSGDDEGISFEFDESDEGDEEELAVAEDTPDWLAGIGDSKEAEEELDEEFDFSNELADDQEEVEEEFDFDIAEDEEDAVAEATPDWLSGIGHDEEPQEELEEEFDFSNELADDQEEVEEEFDFDIAEDEEDAVAEATPDWLSGIGHDEEPQEELEEEFDFSNELADDQEEVEEEFDFDIAEDEEDAVAEATPDWLSGIGHDEEPQDELDEEFDFSNELADDQEEVEEEFDFDIAEDEEDAVAEATPDWLSGIGHDEEPQEELEEEFDFSNELADDQEEVEEEFDFDIAEDEEDAVAEATPDWLSGIGHDEEPQDELDEEFDAFDFEEDQGGVSKEFTELDFGGGDEGEPEEEVTLPSWLDEEQPESFSEDEVVEAAEEFDFASDEEPEDEEEFALAEDTPDWLAGIGDEEADEEEELAEEFDFASDEEPEDEEEFAVAEDSPDWLSGLGDEEPEEDETPADEFDAFDFDEEEPEEEEEFALAEDTPDWLAGIGEEEADEEEELAEEFDFASDEEPEDEEEFALAEDSPDWLSGLGEEEPEEDEVPADEFDAFDFDEEEPEDEEEFALAEDAPDWLSGIGHDEEPQDEEEFAVAEDTPDWLSGLGDEEPEEDEVPADEFDAFDFDEEEPEDEEEFALAEDAPDWLSGIGHDEEPQDELEEEFDFGEEDDLEPVAEVMGEEEIEPVPADNAPDWLNAMVPGLDVDYEAEEDSPIEQDYIKGSSTPSPVGAGRRSAQQIEWLHEIVDSEIGQPPETLPGAMPAAASASAGGQRRAKFVFSQLPIWMRAPVAQSEPEMNVADDDFGEIGDDLPDWLDYDDDLFDDE